MKDSIVCYQPANRNFALRVSMHPYDIGQLRFEMGRFDIIEDRGIFGIEDIVCRWIIKLK